MRTRRSAVLGLLLGASIAGGVPPKPAERMRGVCWEAVGRIGAKEIEPLRQEGVDWISQTPFGWSRSVDSPDVVLSTGSRVYWGESDEGLAETARLARAVGVRTMLKPHLWVGHRDWVGNVRMAGESRWSAWFSSYERFILHYAALAQREHMDALAVGTELCGTTSRTSDWKKLIARIRSVYHGPLTYCANWEEADRVPFWGDLDFIGIQAYYPLSDSKSPTPAELRTAWDRIAARLSALAQRTGRGIVLTEVGYRSVSGGVKEPWNWGTGGGTDLALQAEAYRALFNSLWERPWFAGTFVWKWNPYLGDGAGTDPRRRAFRGLERDFTPQGKPALAVIREYYRRAG